MALKAIRYVYKIKKNISFLLLIKLKNSNKVGDIYASSKLNTYIK